MANFFSRGIKGIINWARDNNDGYYPYSMSQLFGVTPQFNDYSSDLEKLKVALKNPALLKVICLQCDLFSLGKIYVYKGDVEQENDPLLNLFAKPNPFQYRSQWLWDLMFWTMIGNAYLYVDSDIPTNIDNKLYFLQHDKMEWPDDMKKYQDKIVLSKKTEDEIGKLKIKYTYEDNSSTSFDLAKITCISDLSNGVGNWFISPSRIDALYKIISNSEEAIDSTNTNLRYTRKFAVAGQADPKNTTQIPMGEPEKQDIESKMNGNKSVHAFKSMIEVKRFVEDMRSLELGKIYLDQFFLIGSMYNIPRDVLEAYTSSTFENQEKARAGHVSYTLEPKGNIMFEALSHRFKYHEQGKTILISWDHLPFVQVFESDRAKTRNMQIQTMTLMLKNQMSLDEINQFLDTDFKTGKYEQPTKQSGAPNSGAGTGN